jgi:hypothetical protein
MIYVDSRLYQRYLQLRANLRRAANDTVRRECLMMHFDLFYTPQSPGRPILVPHPMDKPT